MHRHLPLFVPLAVAAALRLWALDLLPLHSDEGTYVTWGLRALHARDLGDLLASVEDGKQPLLAWLMPPFLFLVPDRLVAARLVSVATGLLNLWLLYRLGSTLWDRRVGWVAAALYAVVPISLVHDRMALYDSLVATTSLLVLAAAARWTAAPTWPRTVALGLGMGLALLTKLSALFFVALVPALILVWHRPALRRWWRLAHAYLLAAAIYSVMYASPLVKNIEEGNFQRYSLTAGEVLAFPLSLWAGNAAFIAEAAWTYLTWPVLAAALGGLAWGTWRGSSHDRALTVWTLAPVLAFALTAKLFYSRYLVFCFVAALLPAARGLLAAYDGLAARTPRRRFAIYLRTAVAVLGLGGLLPSVSFALLLLTDPVRAPWMNDRRFITDRFQYVESNYAGYGLLDVVRYLRAAARQQDVAVLTRPATGMPRDGVAAYLSYVPGVTLGHVGENESVQQRITGRLDRLYQVAARGGDLYYVLTDAPGGEQEQRFRQLNPGLAPVLVVPKPGGHSRFQLYKVPVAPGPTDWLDPAPRLGDAITLEGYQIALGTASAQPTDMLGRRPRLRPSDTVRLTLFWGAVARPPYDFTVFTHLVGPDGRIWGQHDKPPRDGQQPTSRWQAGQLVGDVYELRLSSEIPAGTYRLITGMYRFETMQRLPVLTAQGERAADFLTLGELDVSASDD